MFNRVMDVTSSKQADALESTAATTRVAEDTESSTPHHAPLLSGTVIIIEQSRTRVAPNVRDLWTYRELLYFLMLRDLKVRYKQTSLGVAWVILQPLLTTLIFTIFLGRLIGVPSDNIPYPIFAYAGLMPWSFFSGAIANTSSSLVSSANLITKVYFPRLIIPIAAIAARLVDFAIAFVFFAFMMIYYRVAVTWHIFMLLPLVVLITLLATGIGLWASAMNVKYRDIGAVLPVLIQLWMYVSPIVYPASFVPKQWQALYALNPLTGIINNFRAALLGQQFEWTSLAVSTAMTVALLIYAVRVFRQMEKSFADIV